MYCCGIAAIMFTGAEALIAIIPVTVFSISMDRADTRGRAAVQAGEQTFDHAQPAMALRNKHCVLQLSAVCGLIPVGSALS